MKKYNPYGENFVIDRIALSDMMDSLEGLDGEDFVIDRIALSDMMDSLVGLPFERTEAEIQAQTRGAVHDTAEPGGGHADGGFYERKRDPVERDDP